LVKGEDRRPRDGDLEKNFLKAFFATNEDEGTIVDGPEYEVAYSYGSPMTRPIQFIQG